ncbi:hypothetical protein ACOMHN_032306 [Nucella lapillus]
MFRGNKKDPDPQKSTPLHKPQDETQPTVEGNGQYETNVRRTMNKPQDETQPTVEGNGQYETNVRRTMNKPQDETQPTVEGNGQYETNVRRTMNKRMLSPDWEEGQNRPREAWLGAGTSEGVGIIPCRRSGEEGSDVDGNGPTLRSTKRFAAEDKSNRDAESGSPSVMRKAAPSLMTRGPKKTTRERVEARTQDLDFGVIDPRPDIFGTATCGAGLNLDRRRSSDRSSVDSAHYIRVPKGQEVGVSSAGSHYIHAGGEEDVVEKCHVSLESEPTAVDSRVDAFPYASSAKHVQGYRIPAAHSHQRNRSSRSEAGLLRARTPSYCSSVDRNKDSEGEIYHDVPETLSDGSNSETPTDGRNYEADFDIQQRNQQSAKLKKKERNLDDMEKGIGHRIKETHERGTRNCPEDMDGSTEARSDLNSISRREENEDNRPQRRRYSGRQTIRQVHNDPYLKLEAEYFNENQAVLDSLRLEGQWKPDSDLLPTLARHNAQENLEDLTFQEKAGIPECEHEIQYDFENLQHMLQRQPPPLPGFYSGHFEDKDLREDFCSEEPQSPEIEQRAVALQCPNLEPEQWLYYQEDAHSEHKHERQAPLATGPKSSRESSTNPPQRPSLRGEEGLQFQLDPDQIHHHHHHNQGQPQIPHTPTNKTRPLTQPSLITTTRVKPVQPSLITTTRVKLNLSRPKRPSSLPLKFVCQPLEARGLGQHPQPQKPSQDGSGGRPPPTGGDPSSAREKRSRRRQQENHLLLMERGDIHNLHLLEDLKERESSGGGRSNVTQYNTRQDKRREDKRREDKTRQEKRREEKTREDKRREEKRRQEKRREDKTRQEKRREEKTREEKRRQDKTRKEKRREDKRRQEKRREEKTREDKRREDKTRQEKTRREKRRQDQTREEKTRPDERREDKRREDKTRREKRRQDQTREEKTRPDERREDKTKREKRRQEKTREEKRRQDKRREDKTRREKRRQDQTREEKTRQDERREDKTRREKRRQEKRREDKTRPDERREDKTRREKRRQDKTRGEKRRQDQTREEKTRQDQTREEKTRPDERREDKRREEKTRQDQTREEKTRPDERREDKTRPEERREDKTRREKRRQDKTRREKRRQDQTREEKTRQDQTREEKTRPDERREDKTRPDERREDKTRREKRIQDKTRREKRRQDQTREEKTRQDQTREEKTRPDERREDKTRREKRRQDQMREEKTRPDETRRDQTRPDERKQDKTKDNKTEDKRRQGSEA